MQTLDIIFHQRGFSIFSVSINEKSFCHLNPFRDCVELEFICSFILPLLYFQFGPVLSGFLIESLAQPELLSSKVLFFRGLELSSLSSWFIQVYIVVSVQRTAVFLFVAGYLARRQQKNCTLSFSFCPFFCPHLHHTRNLMSKKSVTFGAFLIFSQLHQSLVIDQLIRCWFLFPSVKSQW